MGSPLTRRRPPAQQRTNEARLAKDAAATAAAPPPPRDRFALDARSLAAFRALLALAHLRLLVDAWPSVEALASGAGVFDDATLHAHAASWAAAPLRHRRDAAWALAWHSFAVAATVCLGAGFFTGPADGRDVVRRRGARRPPAGDARGAHGVARRVLVLGLLPPARPPLVRRRVAPPEPRDRRRGRRGRPRAAGPGRRALRLQRLRQVLRGGQRLARRARRRGRAPLPRDLRDGRGGRARRAAAALRAPDRAAKESEIPNFKGSYLGRFPLVSADFWTSDHLSERPRT